MNKKQKIAKRKQKKKRLRLKEKRAQLLKNKKVVVAKLEKACLLYTSPSPRDRG